MVTEAEAWSRSAMTASASGNGEWQRSDWLSLAGLFIYGVDPRSLCGLLAGRWYIFFPE
jgi:hypothetical protein